MIRAEVQFTVSDRFFGSHTGFTNSSIAVHDFDADGVEDLVISGDDDDGISQLFVVDLIDSGVVKDFKYVFNEHEGVTEGDLAVADFDRDDLAEIVVSGLNRSDSAMFRLVHSLGDTSFEKLQFRADTDFQTAVNGLYHGELASGDLTGNNRLDLVFSGRSGPDTPQLSVLHQSASGTFTTAQNDFQGPDPGLVESAIALGNIDNGSFLDLAVLGTDRTSRNLFSYKNDGTGHFDTLHDMNFSGGLTQGSLAWADYDSDGDSDLAVAGLDQDGDTRFIIFRTTRNGPMEIQSQPLGSRDGYRHSSMAWGMANHDTMPDLAVMGQTRSGPKLHLYINEGDGNFRNPVNVSPGEGFYHGELAWSDFNDDGLDDLVVVGSDESGTPVPSFRVLMNESVRDEGSGDDTDPEDENSCLLERTQAPDWVLRTLRELRDRSMVGRVGRFLTRLYYSIDG